MATIEQILSVPCPTCKMPADSECVTPEGGDPMPPGGGIHSTRIYRFEVVSEAIAHNEEVMTNEIAVRQPAAVAQPDQAANTSTDLEHWARQYVAAAQFAQGVCSTLMVPVAFRGKPEEATAAILAGAELGFSPMRSLNAFDNIQGTPAPKAITLRALVQAAGHKVAILESSDDKAVVMARRQGDTDWQTSTWDLARAKKLKQYATNPNWKTNPGQMLVARATAEVCRWVASDAIMGIPYAAEEIEDIPAPVVAPAVRRLTTADLDEPAAIEAAPVAVPVTREQQKLMFALWGDLGYNGDENRAQRLEITSKILGGLVVESSSDLTQDQAHEVIAALEERKARQGGPQ
jgi:hypothetical protein